MPAAPPSPAFDAVVLGAGAAGLFCASRMGRAGRKVLVIDHAAKPAEKVRISGGGRCNFTNIHTAPDRFISENPHFAKSALARYTPQDFLDLLARHEITWHEKTLGQLFCDQKAGAIIRMLLDELDAGGGELRLNTQVTSVSHADGLFTVDTSGGRLAAPKLVIATGGLSIPKMGASGLAYDIARQFGHAIVQTRAALVPFVFTGADHDDFASISGVACDVRASTDRAAFDEAMLFTHRGLSGPAILQVSSYWSPGEPVTLTLLPGTDIAGTLKTAKRDRPQQTLASALEALLPSRLAHLVLSRTHTTPTSRLADTSHATLDTLAGALSSWVVRPAGTEGWRTAEVTAGGIDTSGLSSKTMESRHLAGLYFIGECVDVTGWLGGYNFQWAWASAAAGAEGAAA
ncbi:NAD(P)/FAD-dependent oxidoreductase [Hyphomonas johnsonii]|uniref:Oxidoreductase n=1 Tax=Hyphomonas johnsonii MHS-2 TaxID=1280950 RepID=A0A059FJ16_9PROT|nr:NAD(P)/FAD-dependent oxidoreductase [Hyphomonas johnsonii]KCZ90660.1 oxidoreductase [Hyphomonas johnsonii MHS-2]